MGSLKLILSSLVLVFVIAGVLIGAESKTYWGDIEVLKELKNGFDPGSLNPGSCVSSWDFTIDPCDNLFGEKFTCGFRCDLVVSGISRITELGLDQAGYAGSLSSISWNLPYLETLDLSSNFFSGAIPDSLSNLTRLRRLGLSRNLFTGEIPSSIGSLPNLEELYLDNNNLQGTMPASLNGLVSLKRLEIQSNKLNGTLPDLGSLRNLYYLDISDNAIVGEPPATLPSSLIQISMRNNSLGGTLIPESFINLMSLQSELIAIDLSNNELQGLLPSFMALMPKLSALSLENNKFTGMIPTQYALKAAVPDSGISPFARLLLGGNYLFGPIPDPLRFLKPGSANVRLVDNCLYRCPDAFFFCQGGDQKSLTEYLFC
ncbi:Leucine-rich repeat receptor-like protein kinase [Quillaja saponaria]|uniref:Leucine-rich repeat receptor-like protein kinase n=1 Tax=Quillaja saponaria TaxID=32244 RepID=A0AAD7L7J5_QUISA|nr:Leucine-rich repeat receptor-like protein kinase [Quillaja saponaria]